MRGKHWGDNTDEEERHRGGGTHARFALLAEHLSRPIRPSFPNGHQFATPAGLHFGHFGLTLLPWDSPWDYTGAPKGILGATLAHHIFQ